MWWWWGGGEEHGDASISLVASPPMRASLSAVRSVGGGGVLRGTPSPLAWWVRGVRRWGGLGLKGGGDKPPSPLRTSADRVGKKYIIKKWLKRRVGSPSQEKLFPSI